MMEQGRPEYILFNGEIHDDNLYDLDRFLARRLPRRHVRLLLTTNGGDPDTAYRIAKRLQRWHSFDVIIPSVCKSAGTLLALGANQIFMAPGAELGPLDLQKIKKDNLLERESVLDSTSAFHKLDMQATRYFQSIFIQTLTSGGGSISLDTAARIATQLTVGMYSTIYSKIDPLELGHVSRLTQIALQYGERLNKRHKNAKPGAVQRLITDYPSHGFVIDIEEAADLFWRVAVIDGHMHNLIGSIGILALKPLPMPMEDDRFRWVFLTEEAENMALTSGDLPRMRPAEAEAPVAPVDGADPGNSKPTGKPAKASTAGK